MRNKNRFTAKDARIVFKQFMEEVKNCLVEDNHIEIRGFGTFKFKNHRGSNSSKSQDEPGSARTVKKEGGFQGAQGVE